MKNQAPYQIPTMQIELVNYSVYNKLSFHRTNFWEIQS